MLWVAILAMFLVTLVCGAMWKRENRRHILAVKRECSALEWVAALAEDEGNRLRAEQLGRTDYIVTGHTCWGEETWVDGVFSDKQDAARAANRICQTKWPEQFATILPWTVDGDMDSKAATTVEPNPLPPPPSH